MATNYLTNTAEILDFLCKLLKLCLHYVIILVKGMMFAYSLFEDSGVWDII